MMQLFVLNVRILVEIFIFSIKFLSGGKTKISKKDV
jgi:hypothetical protein